jgi:hypothetical protein
LLLLALPPFGPFSPDIVDDPKTVTQTSKQTNQTKSSNQQTNQPKPKSTESGREKVKLQSKVQQEPKATKITTQSMSMTINQIMLKN